MFSSKSVDSTDPDEFFTLVRPHYYSPTITERGVFRARARLFECGRLYAQKREEHLARVVHVANARPGVLFLTKPGPPIFCNGAEIGYANLLLYERDTTFISRVAGPVAWGAMTLASDAMATVHAAYLGTDPEPVAGFKVMTPPAATLALLRYLHGHLTPLAEMINERVGPIRSPLALEELLITAMLDNIVTAEARPDALGRQHHHLIINRFLEALDDPGIPISMPALGRKIGVSCRTLRLACQEQLGVSPGHYLRFRRMQLARRALRQADPALTRVTDIATEFGFWELGRFAVNYHKMFGETPSATLRASELGVIAAKLWQTM